MAPQDASARGTLKVTVSRAPEGSTECPRRSASQSRDDVFDKRLRRGGAGGQADDLRVVQRLPVDFGRALDESCVLGARLERARRPGAAEFDEFGATDDEDAVGSRGAIRFMAS